MSDSKTLYDADFVAWTEQQAEALRSAGRGKTNQPLDWENLAEEIESLGRSNRRELRSQIYRVIRHLAKLQFSPAMAPRRGWFETVGDGRMEIGLLLEDSPSLRREVEQMVIDQTPKATRRALSDLDEFGETDPTMQRALAAVQYTAAQVIGDDWFPPKPDAAKGGA